MMPNIPVEISTYAMALLANSCIPILLYIAARMNINLSKMDLESLECYVYSFKSCLIANGANGQSFLQGPSKFWFYGLRAA